MPLVNPATGGGSIGATTGTGSVVLENTPTLITPNIGAATGSSLAVTGALTAATATTTGNVTFLPGNGLSTYGLSWEAASNGNAGALILLNSKLFLNGGLCSRNGQDLKLIGAETGAGILFYTNADSTTPKMTLSSAGALSVVGAVTGSNLSGTNTGDQDLSALTSIGLAAGLAIALG